MGSISDSDSNDDMEATESSQTSYDLGKGVAIPRWERMLGLRVHSNPNLLYRMCSTCSVFLNGLGSS